MFDALKNLTEWESRWAFESGVVALWEQRILGDSVTIAVIDSGVNKVGLGDRVTWASDLTADHDPADLLGHGTEMSELILRWAPLSKIASIKVIDKDGSVTREIAVRALEECQTKRPNAIRLINMSIGIPRRFWIFRWCTYEKPCVLCARVNAAVDSGSIVVVAAGNRGPKTDTLTCPGMAIKAMAVGSISDSTTETWLQLVKRKNTKVSSGTSISAARVTGGIALILSSFPEAEMDEIRDTLRRTGTRIGSDQDEAPREAHFYRAYKLMRHKRQGGVFDPETAYQHWQKAAVLRNANRISECLVELEQAVKLAPTSHTFYSDLGAVYFESGHAADAFEALRESIRLHWKSGPNHYNLGFVLERRGDHEQAEAEYAIAYSFGDRLPPRGALIVSF
jgi:hypothetical protein